MQAMVLQAIGQPLTLLERPPPQPGAGEVLVRVEACAVCRTDLHVVDGELPDPKLPIVPGHEIVGIVEVCAESHPDSTTDDPRWDCVDIRAVKTLPRPVSLDQAKADPRLAEMALVTNTRLSVQPVTKSEWKIICELAGL